MGRLIFHSSFLRFLAGFTALVVVSFSIIVAVGYYEVEVKGKGATLEPVRAAPVEP